MYAHTLQETHSLLLLVSVIRCSCDAAVFDASNIIRGKRKKRKKNEDNDDGSCSVALKPRSRFLYLFLLTSNSDHTPIHRLFLQHAVGDGDIERSTIC